MGGRTLASAGALLALAVLLIWAGWGWKMGEVLAAVLCPAQLEPTS